MENERKKLWQQEQQQGLGDKPDVAQSYNGDVDVQDVERNDAGFISDFNDHFSLQQPTSDVRFRGNAAHVYELRSSQIQLVAITSKQEDAAESISNETARHQVNADLESKEHSLTIEMKEVVADQAAALSLLRATYTVVALFFTGIVISTGRQYKLASTLRSRTIALTLLILIEYSRIFTSCSLSAFS
jgi:hypothetical protein